MQLNQPLVLKTPNFMSRLENAQCINNIVGISLNPLNKDIGPRARKALGLRIPSRIDSIHEGSV